jgi:hypothetical protein
MEMATMEDIRNIQIMIEEFGHKHPEIKLEKSPISDCDITELEVNLGITLPNAVKDYFRSYTFSVPFVVGRMLGDFSKTYCEETGRWRELEIEEEIATQILHLPLMFPDFDLGEFENINRVFAGTGYLWLGTYNEDHYVLIEMQSGQIYRVDMGRIRLTTTDEARVDILKWALPFFHSFEDLVRCFFADELYDEEEMIFDAE